MRRTVKQAKKATKKATSGANPGTWYGPDRPKYLGVLPHLLRLLVSPVSEAYCLEIYLCTVPHRAGVAPGKMRNTSLIPLFARHACCSTC